MFMYKTGFLETELELVHDAIDLCNIDRVNIFKENVKFHANMSKLN